MAQEIGQTSRHQPGVVYDGSLFHMVFSANDDSNRILYATSPDQYTWTLGPDTGQSSGAAPALTLYQAQVLIDYGYNLLVLVFVANDPSNRILYSILDLNENPELRGWRYMGQLNGESAQAVSVGVGPVSADDPAVVATVYFTANDPSNRLLWYRFVPLP